MDGITEVSDSLVETVLVGLDELTASEALYGFVGWLTTQPVIIKMGASENCTSVIDAVAAFCKENGLTEPRDGWYKNLAHPPVALNI